MSIGRGAGEISHMFERITVAVLVMALVSACASSELRSLSPDEASRLRYGNFCGAGHPAVLGSLEIADSEARINALNELRPVDDLDAICRLHDLCYEAFGHNVTPCDLAITEALVRLSDETQGRCQDLASEWAVVFSRVKRSRSPVPSLFSGPLGAALDSLGLATIPSAAGDRLLRSALRTDHAESARPEGGDCFARTGLPTVEDAFHVGVSKAMAVSCGWIEGVAYMGGRPVGGRYEYYYGVPTRWSRTMPEFYRQIRSRPDGYDLRSRAWLLENCNRRYRVFDT